MLPWRRRLGVTLSCTFSVLFICTVFSTPFPATLTREELLYARESLYNIFSGVYTLRNFFLKIFWPEEHCVSGSSGARFSLLPWR